MRFPLMENLFSCFLFSLLIFPPLASLRVNYFLLQVRVINDGLWFLCSRRSDADGHLPGAAGPF